MHSVPDDFSVPTLVKAIKANLFDWYRYLGRSPKAEFCEGPNLAWLLTGMPIGFLNTVFSTQLPPDHADEIIAEALTHFRARNVSRLWWWPEPASQAEELGKRLLKLGFTWNDGSTGMAANLLTLPADLPQPNGLTILPVENKEMLEKFVWTAGAGYEFPESAVSISFDLLLGLGFELPLRSYLALLDGRPVAASQLFLSAGVAGIYWVATVPEVRQQGIGTAITLTPLLEAREMGYHVGILHASKMGYPVYCRLGFQEYCKMSSYWWKG